MTDKITILEKSSGFTIIELVVTLTVAAILMAAAAPSFRDLIQSNRLTASVNDLSGAINVARSESVKRGKRVTLCKSSDGNACATTGTWDQGWIVFVDDSNDAVHDATEELLRVYDGAEGDVIMTGNGNVANYISYMPEGRAQLAQLTIASQTGNIDACLAGKQRTLQLSFAGRIRIVGGTC